MSVDTGTLWWLPRILADTDLDPTETLLLIGLADHVNADDRCFVGITRLAAYARVSYATARRRLAALEERGRITRHQLKRPDGGASVYEYQLLRPADDPTPPLNLSGPPRSPGRADPPAHPDARAELPLGNHPEGTKEIARDEAALAAGFDEFWRLYPRKVAKGTARRAWAAAVRAAGGLAPVIVGAERYRDDPNLPEPRFIPHAATWLSGERWNDPPLPPRTGTAPARRIMDDRTAPEGRLEL